MSNLRKKLTYTQIIVLSFLSIILIGSLLLTLPLSSRSGEWTPFLDAMFTATSATCVTGLVVYDTYTHWSAFGQAIILVLIQIGGLGIMTCIAMLSLILKRRISLSERRLLMQSAGSLQHNGIVILIKQIITGTAIVELCGALLLAIVFCPRMGFTVGLWNAVFHSVSAFCNAGFDLMGRYSAFSSLSGDGLYNNPIVMITLMLLIVIGGIGFLVWNDVIKKRTSFKKYEVHSKIVLTTSALLIGIGFVLFFIFEYKHSLAGMSLGQKLLNALFEAITPRTAGFASVDLNSMSDSGTLLTMILMFIGGSPGSTAGGIKTTTFVVLLLCALNSARRYGSITVFKRKLDQNTVAQASSIATVYAAGVFIAAMIICALEPYSFTQIVFEIVSAVATVGLSTGITPNLCAASQILLMVLMFAGRIGGLTFVLVLAERRINVPISRPTVKILIG
ncbi:MAG: TrkH family potassium uptake protein [Oscillospiraceae bacterium]|nr:TrkH family potassium uptake protein [Oscillospiraceae bacterium]